MNPELRKHTSEQFLQRHGIPILESLPLTEEDDNVHLRDSGDVGERIICLFCLCGTAHEKGDNLFVDYLKCNSLWSRLSAEEERYLSKPTYGDQSHTNVAWRIEALYLLIWAVGLVEELPFPTKEADINDFIECLPGFRDKPNDFIESLSLRPVPVIMDASDLIYRLHWASKRTDKVSEGIMREWHHAINWLTNLNGESWDFVTTDT